MSIVASLSLVLLGVGGSFTLAVSDDRRCGIVTAEDGLAAATTACLNDIDAERSEEARAAMYFQLGYTMNERKSYERGKVFLDRAIQLKPESAEYLQERAYSQSNLGKLPEALADLDSSLQINPDLALAVGQRAFVRYQLGDFTGAIEDYDHMIVLEGEKVDHLFGKASSFIALGRMKEAMAAMKRLEQLPNSDGAMKILTGQMMARLAELTKDQD